MIPRFRPTLYLSDLQAVFQRNSSVEDFERSFANFVGWKYSVLFPYGRTAAYTFFKISSVSDSEVILPAYTCRAMLGAVLASGNRPVFVDCEQGGVNMDTEEVLSKITPRIGAICPTAMYGYPFRQEVYESLSGRIPVLADLALGLFQPAGASTFLTGVDAAIYSLGPGKQTTLLGGGALATNSRTIYDLAREYRDQHFRSRSERLLKSLAKFLSYKLLFSPPLYRALYLVSEKSSLLDHEKGLEIGVSRLLPDDFDTIPGPFQVALGLRQLSRLRQVREARRNFIRRYDEAFRLSPLQRIALLPQHPDCSHYPVFSPQRDELREHLLLRGVHATHIFRELISDLPITRVTAQRQRFPNAERIVSECLLLPLSDSISRQEQDQVISAVLEWDQRE